jgi:ribosome-associated protein
MADTALSSVEGALSVARTLAAHGGGEVVILDVSVQAGWADRFVIATATSSAHMRGLARFVDEEAARLGMKRHGEGPRASDDDEWLLSDFGDIVVHVMTARAREFYELEKLWFQSPAAKVAPPGPAEAAADSPGP